MNPDYQMTQAERANRSRTHARAEASRELENAAVEFALRPKMTIPVAPHITESKPSTAVKDDQVFARAR